MLILFDQGTPVPLRAFLPGHTKDQNIRYQQNLASRKIAIVVLGQANWPIIRVHVARVIAAVNAATPGSYTEIEIAE